MTRDLSSVDRMAKPETLHARLGLQQVINAAGTFTPLGVSRSSPAVAAAVAQALAEFFVIDELQAAASKAVAELTGAQAAAVTHCVAGAITMAVAAAMAGEAPHAVSALPDSQGLPNRVVIPAVHAIDYGHPIVTDIRLAGALPVLAGTASACSLAELEQALAGDNIACLLLVSSRLVKGPSPALAEAVAAAHRRGIPVVIDGAAQDLRLRELVSSGADAVLVSAHKYLASPTAGLIVGKSDFVRACRAQERGVGRAMKASKEAIVGVLAAVVQRGALDQPAWRAEQARKVAWFTAQLADVPGLVVQQLPDPAGMPFARVALDVGGAGMRRDAAGLVQALRDGRPTIRVMEHALAQGRLVLELVPLRDDELRTIVARVRDACALAAEG